MGRAGIRLRGRLNYIFDKVLWKDVAECKPNLIGQAGFRVRINYMFGKFSRRMWQNVT